MNSTTNTQTSNAQTQALPAIAGHEIPMDEHGRFNLNAIHRASESDQNKRPGNWSRTAQAMELIDELESKCSDLSIKVIESRKGKGGGTYAHELLAVSYAGWISPRFQLQVNQVFLDYRMGNLQTSLRGSQAALPNPLSPAHQRGIQKAIARRAQSLPKAIQRTAYSRIYSYLKDRFEVGSYKDIDESRYTEALAAVETVSLEGELLEAAMPAEAVEIDLPATKPWHKLRSHELYGNDIGYRSALSQLLKTLDACKEDGVPVRVKNIDGLKQEVLALRSSLENADERAWTDGELSHLYLVLHYVGLVNRDWHDYRLDEVLRNLESPARAMSESVKVASLYARNIAGHRGHQLLSARDRLGMSGNALLAI